MNRLYHTDEDGDTLEAVNVCGFGEPTAAVIVESKDDGSIAGVNLDLEAAVKLRDWLTKFIELGLRDGGAEADSAKLNPMNGRA